MMTRAAKITTSRAIRHTISNLVKDLIASLFQSTLQKVYLPTRTIDFVNIFPMSTSFLQNLGQRMYLKRTGSKDNDESSNPTYHFQPRQGPNCVTVPINFTEGLFTDQNDRLREYIPNEYELPPKSWAKDVFEKEKVVMHGMGLIALRDLKDEELFYDYRMSPNENAKGSLYPSWYYVWDVDAATNRWSTDDE
mmetsp:Transcript_23900/g.47448  ORF Transcript_23900/g.47448 Transcript_23900/m.47448 type:complete len:193 (+) Transcript_23900:1419-1997(+)